MVAPTSHAPPPPSATDGIVTPEAVVLEFSEAGVGSRSLALLLDLVLWFLVLATAGSVIASAAVAFLSVGGLVAVLFVGIFVVLYAYPVVCETFWNGRTVGKMLLGLRVVTVEGAPVRFRHAAIRAALGTVDLWVTGGLVAILSALLSRRSQRLGDLAAGTIVIRERKDGAYAQPIVFPVPAGWEGYADGLDVSALTDEAYVLLRSFLLRVHEMRPQARDDRAEELAQRIAGRIGVEVPAGHSPETFLVVVAAAYQARHGGPQAVAPRHARWGAAAPGTIPPPVWEEEPPTSTWGSPSPKG